MRWLLLTTFLCHVNAMKNVFVSSPFDNFRIECPKKSGSSAMHVRMVESVGAKRQDIVFEMTCEGVSELYPWVNIPQGIVEMEREDCRYTQMFDPIIDENVTLSCAPREYVAGITRIAETKIQVMCCRLRTRAEFNCNEQVFNKPLGPTRSTIIENDNQLINSIGVQDMQYKVRFCDFAPRKVEEIYDDVKSPRKPSESSSTSSPTTREAAPVNQQNFVDPSNVHFVHHKEDPHKVWKKPFKPEQSISTETPTTSTEKVTTTSQETTTESTTVSTTPSTTTKSTTVTTTTEPTTTTTTEKTTTTTQEATTSTEAVTFEPVEDNSKEVEVSEAPKLLASSVKAPLKEDIGSAEADNELVELADGKKKEETPFETETEVVSNTSDEKEMASAEELSEVQPAVRAHGIASVPMIDKAPIPPAISDILKKIEHASSEQQAHEIFKESVAKLLGDKEFKHMTGKPLESSEATVGTTAEQVPVSPSSTSTEEPSSTPVEEEKIEDISVDLSRISFPDKEFPQPNNKFDLPEKARISTNDLPLRGGSHPDYIMLRAVNKNGQRRAPIRTHRPHVVVLSSEDEDPSHAPIGNFDEMVNLDSDVDKHDHKITRIVKKTMKKPSTPMKEKPEKERTSEAVVASSKEQDELKDNATNDATVKENSEAEQVENNVQHDSKTKPEPSTENIDLPAKFKEEEKTIIKRKKIVKKVRKISRAHRVPTTTALPEEPEEEETTTEMITSTTAPISKSSDRLREYRKNKMERKRKRLEEEAEKTASVSDESVEAIPPPRKMARTHKNMDRSMEKSEDESVEATTHSNRKPKHGAKIHKVEQLPLHISTSTEESKSESEEYSEEVDRDHTTTKAPRADIRFSETTTKRNKLVFRNPDNAGNVDEETDLSPFEDNDSHIKSQEVSKNDNGILPGFELGFQEDMDVEEAIMRLTAKNRKAEIRRAPVRIPPKEQFSDKTADDSKDEGSSEEDARMIDNTNKELIRRMKEKDGVKTYTKEEPIEVAPIVVYDSKYKEPGSISTVAVAKRMSNEEPSDEEETTTEKSTVATTVTTTTEDSIAETEETVSPEELLPMVKTKKYKLIKKRPTTTAAPTTTTTVVREEVRVEEEEQPPSDTRDVPNSISEGWIIRSDERVETADIEAEETTPYDPSVFYHTPRPHMPWRREKFLTFCTKDIGLRDSHNMVIACGDEEGEWVPPRCPDGSSCFLSHDATYRICCAVSSG